jgi:hypothetical protein
MKVLMKHHLSRSHQHQLHNLRYRQILQIHQPVFKLALRVTHIWKFATIIMMFLNNAHYNVAIFS